MAGSQTPQPPAPHFQQHKQMWAQWCACKTSDGRDLPSWGVVRVEGLAAGAHRLLRSRRRGSPRKRQWLPQSGSGAELHQLMSRRTARAGRSHTPQGTPPHETRCPGVTRVAVVTEVGSAGTVWTGLESTARRRDSQTLRSRVPWLPARGLPRGGSLQTEGVSSGQQRMGGRGWRAWGTGFSSRC